jgi:putative transposase
MIWARMLAYITGTVDQELPSSNEYLAAENRILRAQSKGRLLLSDAEKAKGQPAMGSRSTHIY